jgi:hemin uptake protein HemP
MDSVPQPEDARLASATIDQAIAAAQELPRWTTEQILAGGKEALIVHGDLVYRLRLTRSGKLLLFK